jgi:uncharacterized protein with PIN domain
MKNECNFCKNKIELNPEVITVEIRTPSRIGIRKYYICEKCQEKYADNDHQKWLKILSKINIK